MGTTNILDLNNRLTKVEKENVAQNSYTSLKNKPKINNVTLTGNKSLADIGAAAAADLGELTDLTTTDKSSCVSAINEVNGKMLNTGVADGLFCYVQSNTGNTIIGVRSSALGKNIGIQIAPDGTLSRYEEPFS